MNGKEYKLMVQIAGEIDKTFTSTIKQTKKEVRNLKQMTADETFTVLDQGFNKIEGIGKKALNTIKRTAELAAVAVAGIGTAATNAGMEFEAAMSTVQAISGADSSQLDELTEKARELTRNSIYSGTEIADAMQYMGMAGWKTEQILAGIEPVLALATASGEEFALVSDIVTDNLTAFNMEAEEAGRMADVMAAAAMNSNTNVQKMGETFKYAGPVAGALGFSIEDVAIATGLMASSGVKANMAGTALRNIFTRMVKPTKDAQKAMEAFGISIEEIDPATGEKKVKSLMDIMLQMRESVNGHSEDEIRGLMAGLSGGLTAEEKKYYEALSEEELDALVLAEELSEAEKKNYEAMSQVDKASYAAGLAGQRGMTGLLTILNASDEDFKALTEAIYGSAGAAEYMANVKVDNLKGDLAILKNNITDAGVEIYDTFGGSLRELAQGATEWIRNNIKNIPKWVDQISAQMATLKRKAGKYLEPVFDMVVGGGKWLIKNKSGVIGVITGIGTALAAYKIASETSHIITAIKEFISTASPVTIAITGVTAVIGTLAGAITAYKLHEQELLDQDLAEHFGNITLTMGELDSAARAIVDGGSMEELKRQLEAFDELESLRSNIQDHFDEINKITWKVSLGFELTGDLKEQYLSEIQEAAKEQNEYATDTAYLVNQLFPEEDAISLKVREFYTDNMLTMQKLGEELAKLVNEAYEKELLDSSDIDLITKKQQEMAEIQKAISLGEQDAKLALLGQNYENGSALEKESFQNLQKQLEEVLKENEEIFNEYYIKKYAALSAAEQAARKKTEAEGKTWTEEMQKEWNDSFKALNDEKTLSEAEQSRKSLEFQIKAIKAAYGDALEDFTNSRDELLKEYLGEEWTPDWNIKPGLVFIDLSSNILDNVDEKKRENIGTLLENLQSQLNDFIAMSETQGLSDTARKKLNEQIDGIKEEISVLYAITGDTEGLKADIYDNINKMLEEGSLDEGEKAVAEKVKDFIQLSGSEYLKEAEQEAQKAYDETLEILKMKFKAGYDVVTELRLYLQTNYPDLYPTTHDYSYVNDPEWWKTHTTGDIGHYVAHNASGGLIDKETLSWLAEDGPEMVIPLDGSRRAFELWEQAGTFMNTSLLDSISGLFGESGNAYGSGNGNTYGDGNSHYSGSSRSGYGFDGYGNGYDSDGNSENGNSEIRIEYSPTLQFYGDAPSRDDISDALRLSQDEFEDMMEKYLKKNARLAF